MSCGRHCDAFVIGGGPAGATAARLLASWGWSVVVAHRPMHGRQSLAESLPPSTRKLFSFLGQLDAIEAAGFHHNDGNVACWGGAARDTHTSDAGFHVSRAVFDAVLRREAASAGARVIDAIVRRVDLGEPHHVEYACDDGMVVSCTAGIVLDCSGRAGVVARRGFRRTETRYRTLAIAAEWDCPEWPSDEHTRTLVESYDEGWAWSVPLSAMRRQCTVMVEPRSATCPEVHRREAFARQAEGVAPQETKAGALQQTYERAIARSREILSRVTGARQTSAPWTCDASVYDAPRPGDRGVLLVGDAASFIEPLSSAGVRKAITSAWRAAVVANTGLTKPAMAGAAVDYFVERERQVFTECQRVARQFFNEAAAGHASAFWSARAEPPEPDAAGESPDVRRAFDRLRAAAQIRLRPASALRFAEIADIEGREVVLREAIVMPGADVPVRFAAGVNLPALVRLAPEFTEVPELFSAYNTHVGPVPMDGLLTGLSLLVARQALIHEDARS